MIIVAHLQRAGKYAIRKQPFIMGVKNKIALSGRCLSAVLEIVSSPGFLLGGSLFIKCWIVPSVVEKVLWNGDVLISCTLENTSGRSGPGLRKNCTWKVSAKISVYSFAERAGSFGPSSGWVTGVLLNSFLLSLYMDIISGLRESMNRSHSSCLCVFSIDRMNAILLLILRLVAGSWNPCHS